VCDSHGAVVAEAAVVQLDGHQAAACADSLTEVPSTVRADLRGK
jgi:hypothetical protein